MALSERTKTTVATAVERDVDGLYPDMCATPDDTSATPQTREYSVRETTATSLRLQGIASTTKDMSALFKWEYGDEIYGTHAKAEVGMHENIDDIEFDYGREDDYKPYYIDTLSEKRTVGEQLAEQGKK